MSLILKSSDLSEDDLLEGDSDGGLIEEVVIGELSRSEETPDLPRSYEIGQKVENASYFLSYAVGGVSFPASFASVAAGQPGDIPQIVATSALGAGGIFAVGHQASSYLKNWGLDDEVNQNFSNGVLDSSEGYSAEDIQEYLASNEEIGKVAFKGLESGDTGILESGEIGDYLNILEEYSDELEISLEKEEENPAMIIGLSGEFSKEPSDYGPYDKREEIAEEIVENSEIADKDEVLDGVPRSEPLDEPSSETYEMVLIAKNPGYIENKIPSEERRPNDFRDQRVDDSTAEIDRELSKI